MKKIILASSFLLYFQSFAVPYIVNLGRNNSGGCNYRIYDQKNNGEKPEIIGDFSASCRVQQNTPKDVYVDLTKDKEFYKIVKSLYDKAKISADFTKTQFSNQLPNK